MEWVNEKQSVIWCNKAWNDVPATIFQSCWGKTGWLTPPNEDTQVTEFIVAKTRDSNSAENVGRLPEDQHFDTLATVNNFLDEYDDYEERHEALTEATIQEIIDGVHTSETYNDTEDSEEQENTKHSDALGLIKGLLCYAEQEALDRDELKQLLQKFAKHAIL